MSATPAASELLRTPLADLFVERGARMVDFAGWYMPVQFDGVIAEHTAVRTSAGIFDVSHMGQLTVEGPSAAADLQALLSNDIGRLDGDGTAQYTLLTNERGGIEDDLIVYRLAADSYFLVVNAANAAHDFEWIRDRVSDDTVVSDVSAEWAMIALQGPQARAVLADAGHDVSAADRFHLIRDTDESGAALWIATTGYTGEDGVELLMPAQRAEHWWRLLSADERATECGLAARDTLRLEACYPLHGSDISPTTTAVEAGLAWVCGWQTTFTGSDALARQRSEGPARTLVALAVEGRGIPRAGCAISFGSQPVGEVTSGTMSPTLGRGIALGYVANEHSAVGTAVEIDVRGRAVVAHVAEKPLYRKEQ